MAVFDSEAKSYDSWYDSKLGAFVDKVETNLALGLFKPEKGSKILDIGCGTGNFSIKLEKMGFKVVGIDISGEMLEAARKKARAEGLEIEFYEMDIYSMKFQDEAFDGAISMAAFEFIKEPEKAAAEIFRVVKKGGQILIGTINRDSSWGRLYQAEYFKENTVFKYADFKGLEDLKALKKENIRDAGECLFIPPDEKEENINLDRESELSAKERGGFICVLWEK